eukprot:Awhi_evm2s2530
MRSARKGYPKIGDYVNDTANFQELRALLHFQERFVSTTLKINVKWSKCYGQRCKIRKKQNECKRLFLSNQRTSRQLQNLKIAPPSESRLDNNGRCPSATITDTSKSYR